MPGGRLPCTPSSSVPPGSSRSGMVEVLARVENRPADGEPGDGRIVAAPGRPWRPRSTRDDWGQPIHAQFVDMVRERA